MRAHPARWLIALALSAVSCGGLPGGPASPAGRADARRRCSSNLRSLGLTFQAYREGRGHLPPVAITDPQGKPLLSWRVTILPWLKAYDARTGEVRDVGLDRLYKMFHLGEPWDSPHNKSLIKHMPAVYLCPGEGRQCAEGLTTYRLVVGPGTMFEGLEGVESAKVDEGFITRDGRPGTISTATDGLRDTMVLAEATEATPWTKPGELETGPGLPPPPLGGKHPGEFLVLMADGSVRGVKASTPPERLRALMTRNGNDAVP